MTDVKTTKEDPTKDDKKNLKKLLDSHVSVLEHQLGRAPDLKELSSFLEESSASKPAPEESVQPDQAQSSQPSEPKILSYKVYYGMKNGDDGARSPDPRKILFYENQDGSVYDTAQHNWCATRPDLVDHLPSRPLEYDEQGHDIMSALLHGVLDDDDYNALDGSQMLNEHHKRIWELNKQLRAQMASLEKSEESDQEDLAEMGEYVESPDESQEAQESPEDGSSDDFYNTSGGDGGYDGQVINAVQEILEAALADIKNESEDRIRAIVAEEVSRQMEALMSAMAQDDGGGEASDYPEELSVHDLTNE